jgi:hypothetical protein
MKIRKPVFILLQGPSIEQMDILKYKDADVVWASLNDFRAIEDNILSKIGKKFNMIYCSSDERYEVIKNRLSGKDILTTTYMHHSRLSRNLRCWSNDDAYGFCSLWAMLCALINLEFKEIYIFGCDGYDTNGKTYYGMDYETKGIKSIERDYEIMNKYFWELTEYWGLDLRDIQIINMNHESKLECFSKPLPAPQPEI